jgi:hypothetical protein
MLGSNPSADSVASTDSGGMLRHPPFSCLPTESPHRERHEGAKSWGCGGKAPASYAGDPTFLLEYGRPLIMHNFRIISA